MELTNKARKLTEFLINQNIQITVPKSIIIELKKKGFAKIIKEYTDSKYPIQILGLTKKPTKGLRYLLKRRIEKNFNNMINSNWFEIRPYTPKEISVDSIKKFFENIGNKQKLNEFLTKKRRNDPVPSRTDLELIAFSKDIETPIVSNDYDITFFADELFKRKLSCKIYDFMDLNIYNNE